MTTPNWVRDRGNCHDKDELLNDVESYAREVVAEYDVLEIDLSEIDFEVSSRMSHAYGMCSREYGDITIKISWPAFENRGWEETKATVRHELAHAQEIEEVGYTEEGSYRFQQLLEKLDAPVSADGPARDYKYMLICTECGKTNGRHKKSKTVKKPHLYRCSECGGKIRSETVQN